MLIGLTGTAQSGKTTVATMLGEMAVFQIVGFADPLRWMAAGINPVVGIGTDNRYRYYNDVVAEFGYERAKAQYPEVRRFLQRLGTEGGRKVFGNDFWVDQAAKLVRAFQKSDTPDVVMPDVRFSNEAKFVREFGGSIWRIIRTGHDNSLSGANAQHASEQEMQSIKPDYILAVSNLVELRQAVEQTLELMKESR